LFGVALRQPAAVLLCAGATLLAAAPSAVAQTEPGVVIDPASPASKEYALPVEAAREGLSGDRPGRVVRGDRSAPPFGVGVGHDPSRTASAEKHRSSATAGPNGATGTSSTGEASGAKASPRPPAVVRAALPTGGDGLLALLVGGAVVLILVLAGAVGIRLLSR
jgi:hypothetical protein